MSYRLLPVLIGVLACALSLHAQSASSTGPGARPKAVYTPAPVYRPEWARQGLTGKGVVLVTIDQQTGKVTGARMLESTGSQVLDGSALQAYSQWRFEPGTVSQLKMPIEFSNRQRPGMTSARPMQSRSLYPILILFALGVIIMLMLKRRNR
ncbi:MAG: energy transducer TonB [Chthoniobacterales bacterium]